jgi:hypothetical protein
MDLGETLHLAVSIQKPGHSCRAVWTWSTLGPPTQKYWSASDLSIWVQGEVLMFLPAHPEVGPGLHIEGLEGFSRSTPPVQKPGHTCQFVDFAKFQPLSQHAEAKKKTFHRRDSQVVTNPSTCRPISCLNRPERTRGLAFNCLWRNVTAIGVCRCK